MKILVADDDPCIRHMLATLLSLRGIACSFAEDGPATLAAWEAGSFDIILMDVEMPHLNGLEVTRRIRQQEEGRGERVTVIGLTAHSLPEHRKECLQSGMDVHFAKPITFSELLSFIEEQRHRKGGCLTGGHAGSGATAPADPRSRERGDDTSGIDLPHNQ